MYVVAGVTGRTGSVVADTLLERKQRIRVIVRTREKGASWQVKGAEVAVASLEDVDSMTKALDGAAGAYVLIPPHDHASDYLKDLQKVVDALADAVGRSHLPHVVFLSSIGAHLPAGTGPIRALHYGERRLGAVSPGLTVLRASYFMDNWIPALGPARTQGVLPSFLSQKRKIPMIATGDIGRFAAESLLNPAKGRRVLELTGPEEYSPEDVADVIGRRLGRSVVVQHLPLSAAVPTLTSMGFSDHVARLFQDMYAGIESGHITWEGNGACRPHGLVSLSEALSTAV